MSVDFEAPNYSRHCARLGSPRRVEHAVAVQRLPLHVAIFFFQSLEALSEKPTHSFIELSKLQRIDNCSRSGAHTSILEALLERRRPMIDRAGTILNRALRDCSSSREASPRAKGSHPSRGPRLPSVAILPRFFKTSFSGQGCLWFSELERSARVLTLGELHCVSIIDR